MSFALAVLSVVYSLFFLKIDSNQDSLISSNKPYHQRYLQFIKDFGDQEPIVVVFENNQDTKIIAELANQLKKYPNLFSEIFFQFEIRKNASPLLFLPEESFSPQLEEIKKHAPLMTRLSRQQDLASFLDVITKALHEGTGNSSGGFDFINTFVNLMDQPLQMREWNPLSTQSLLSSADGEITLLIVQPVKNYSTLEVIGKPLSVLRQEVDKIRRQYPGLSIGITGRPVLQADEMRAAGSDSQVVGVLSFIGVALLLLVGFRSLKRPGLALLSLACGIAWSWGFMTLTLGHLNLLTMVFSVILIGLGMDYGIHFLRGYELDPTHNIERVFAHAWRPLMISAVSTSLAFYMALFTDFLGLKELGWVAGSGVLLCLFSQLITFPALLCLATKPKKLVIASWNGALAPWIPKATVGLILLLVPFLFKLRFDHNLLNLQNPALESVRFEKLLMSKPDLSTWFAISLGPDIQSITLIKEKMKRLATVSHVESLHDFFPPDQEERIQKIKSINLDLSPSIPKTEDPEKLSESLKRFELALGEIQNKAFRSGKLDAVETLERLKNKVQEIRKSLPEKINLVRESGKYFFAKIPDMVSTLDSWFKPSPLSMSDIPDSIRKRFVSATNQVALYIHPKEDIWDPENMENFIRDLRTIDSDVVGPPIGVYESSKHVEEGFYRVGVLTLIMVGLLLMMTFQSWRECLLATLPLVVGFIWLLSLMGFFDMTINLGNFFALPILIGISIDNGVHVVHRLKTDSIPEALKTLGPTLLMGNLTAAIGFGSLAFVEHRGLASFGLIMAMGSVCCLITTLILVPFVKRTIAP